mgnify:CR=1 FL=1
MENNEAKYNKCHKIKPISLTSLQFQYGTPKKKIKTEEQYRQQYTYIDLELSKQGRISI